MATAQNFPLLFGESIGVLAHEGTGLRRKVRRGADQHHGLNATRLLGGHVQQDVATSADANGLRGGDLQMIEQGKHVYRGLIMTEWLCKRTGAAVTTQVRQDELESCAPLCEGSDPILAGAGEAVQQQQGLTRCVKFEVELLTIEHFDATGRTCSGHCYSSCGLLC